MRSKADKLVEGLIKKEVLGRISSDFTSDNLFRGSIVLKPGPGEPEDCDVRLVTDYTPHQPLHRAPRASVPIAEHRLPEHQQQQLVVC